jgi:hypothetical protein
MIIGDLNIKGGSTLPGETNSILVIDSNTILFLAIPAQRLEAIAGQRCKVRQRFGSMDPGKFDTSFFVQRCRKESSRDLRAPPIIYVLGRCVRKRPDRHSIVIPYSGKTVKSLSTECKDPHCPDDCSAQHQPG